MAYQTGTASSLENLLTQLDTFLTAQGWTSDQFNTSTNQAAWHKGTVYISMAWPTTNDELSIHHALGYTGGNRPGKHTDDSGNGYNTAATPTAVNILTERAINNIGDGPFPSYHFFEQDSGPAYVHIVVEISTAIYRHFGFGTIVKTGGADWTGGEYCYGQYQTTSHAVSQANNALLDGLFIQTGAENERRAATLHMEGLTGQDAASKWGQVWGAPDGTPRPDDDAGEVKMNVQGGFRAGPVARALGWTKAGASSGLIPGYPIKLYYRDGAANFVYSLGYMPDVRGVNIDTIAPGDEILIAGDTWVFFPTGQKTDVIGPERTYNQGIMYKKVTA